MKKVRKYKIMKLKKVKGTLRQDLDIDYVFGLIEKDKLDGDDVRRILIESLHVIRRLKYLIFNIHSLIYENSRRLSRLRKDLDGASP